MKKEVLFASRCLLLALAILGVVLEILRYGFGMLLYYTVLSNLLVVLFVAYLLYRMKAKEDWQSQNLLRVKGGVTMSIMITCVIYHILLAPIATDFYRLENFLCHYIVPLFFLLDTLVADKQGQYKWLDPLAWTSVPLLYMGFALLNGLVFGLPVPKAKDSPFPYFFLNVGKKGWGYVLTYSAIIFVAYLLAGFVLFAVKSFQKKRKKQG